MSHHARKRRLALYQTILSRKGPVQLRDLASVNLYDVKILQLRGAIRYTGGSRNGGWVASPGWNDQPKQPTSPLE